MTAKAPPVDPRVTTGWPRRLAEAARRNWPLSIPALVGLVVRLVNVLVWRPTCDYVAADWGPGLTPLFEHIDRFNKPAPAACFTFGSGDANFYFAQAKMLSSGAGLGQPFQWVLLGDFYPSAAHPPTYPFFLALVDKVGLTTITQQRIATCLLGVIGVFLVGLAAKQISGRMRAGVVAASLAAVYPAMWISDGKLLSESMYVPAMALILMAAYKFWRQPRPASAVLLGLAIGFGQLTRAETGMLAFIMVPALAFALRHRLSRRSWTTLALLAFLVCQAVVFPWALRNLVTFTNPVLGTTGTGAVLLQTNCEAAYEDPDNLGFTNVNCLAKDPEVVQLLAQAVSPGGGGLDESEYDAIFRRKALDYAQQHKGRAVVVAGARIARAWGWGPEGILRVDGGINDPNSLFPTGIEERGYWPSLVGLVIYYLTLPFAVGGLWVLRRRTITIIPFVSIFVMFTVTAVVGGALTRYRAGVDASLVVLIGIAADAAIAWVARRRSSRSTPPAEGRPEREEALA